MKGEEKSYNPFVNVNSGKGSVKLSRVSPLLNLLTAARNLSFGAYSSGNWYY